MKNILIFLLVLSAIMAAEASVAKIQHSETTKLSEKVDSLTSVIDALSQNIQTITETQEMLVVRMAETREDYTNYLTDLYETRNWTLGVISLIVGAFGVAFPIISNHQAKKKSEETHAVVQTLTQNVDDINNGIMNTQDRINNVAAQINKDREIIDKQLLDIRTIKGQIDKIQDKIKTSENNARESQQRAMISSLFSQALKEEDTNRAIELYTRILKLNPQDVEALNNRSLAYSRTKQYHLALQDIGKYINLKPDSPNGYAIRGLIYLEQKQYSKSIKYFKIAMEKNPQDIRVYRSIVFVYQEMGQWQNVIDTYNIIAQAEGLTAKDYNNRAYAYYKLNKLDIALADVNDSLSMNDDNSVKAKAFDTRACIYIAMGPEHYKFALEDLTTAIELDPNFWECYENRASLYQKMIESTQDSNRKEYYKQLRFADLEVFRKKSCNTNESTNRA